MHRRPAALDLILHCPFCQGLLANDPSLAGRLAYCPQCLNQFQMPGASAVPVAMPASAESLARTVPAVIRNPLTILPQQQQRPVQAKNRATPAVSKAAPAPNPVARRTPAAEPARSAEWAAPLPVVERINWREIDGPAPPTAVPPAAQTPGETPPLPAATPAPAPMPSPAEIDPLAILPQPAELGVLPAIQTGQPSLESGKDCPAFFPDVTHSLDAELPREFPRVAADAPQPISDQPLEVADAPSGEGEPAGVSAVFERNMPAIVTSGVTHAVLLIALAMWIISRESAPPLDLLAEWSPERHTELESAKFEVTFEAPQEFDSAALSEASPTEPAPLQAAESLEVAAPQAVADVREAAPAKTGGKPGARSPFDGRGEGRRQKLLVEGGTPESESAVALGLAWLKEHQYPDGGWRFNHTGCPQCKGECRNPGREESTTGATALALLPFLGAGQTHQQGKYQEVVRRGLYYLVEQMEGRGETAGDFRGEDGNMYCHGLAATALCEAYGMTRDKMLLVPAQKSIDFIAYAQDARGGGWRYKPQQRGDTSVVGWQIMAMKSGHLAYLKVPKQTVTRASDFLDSVSAESGAFYGYTSPGRGTNATTAIGLLCRMHLGWGKDHPGIVRGVEYLAQEGPERSNMYYNYYATQVLHYFGGPHWKRWNEVMREQLVNSQAKNGHETGSWGGRDHHLGEGGRILTTSLSIMTLEVYYRHMPLYRDDALKNEFAP